MVWLDLIDSIANPQLLINQIVLYTRLTYVKPYQNILERFWTDLKLWRIWLTDQSYLRVMLKVSYPLQPYSKLNCSVLGKSTQKDMITDEVGVPNDVLVWLRTHQNYFSLIKWTLGKNVELINIVLFWCTHNWSKWILDLVYYLDHK